MNSLARRILKLALQRVGPCMLVILITGSALVQTGPARATTTVAPLLLSQIPLTVAIPAHPQVLIAVGNSESMDGDMDTSLPGGGGAIMTGSGALTVSGAAYLNGSSSPADYTVPANFTPPVTGAEATAPYTVTSGGVEYDNSPSRLNVAKAGISAILSDFMEYADFGLIDYSTAYDNCCGTNPYTTWVYYMSNPGGFTFTNTAPASGEYVANPCYNVPLSSATTVQSNCNAMNTHYGSIGINTYQYMLIGASSDDPDINDVLYATGFTPIWVNFDGPNNGDPYTTFNLADYTVGGVEECYFEATSGGTGICETPTNAGFVPYSTEVMQVQRGFGFIGTQSATTGHVVVGMQSSGSAPTPASVASAIAQFTPYLQPETNSVTTNEIKAMAIQSPTAGLLKEAQSYYSSVNPPTTNGCRALRYVVLVTDGLPTEDLNGKAWPPLGTVSSAGYGETASFNGNGSLASTNDQALQDTITTLEALNSGSNPVKTYVIGLGAGVAESTNPQAYDTLTAMAVAGGTGSFFPANSPAAVSYDMQVILAQILAATQSTASATVNTTGLNTNSVAFQPSFDTSDLDQDWTGDIKAYPISPSTGQVNSSSLLWSAQAQLDAQAAGTGWDTNRLIATWDPVAGQGIPFRWTAGTPTSGIGATTTLGQELETNTSDPSGVHALRYLRGDAHWELADTGIGFYRNRSHILADIVDSAPLYVGGASGPYQNASYYSFEQSYLNREPVIYAGANDGMLHAFNAATGAELFAFIPNGVFANLINLTSPFYNEQHRFYVDGSPQASDVQFADGSWHTVLVSGERAGGQTMFALDVTNPAGITSESQLASDVLWEFSDPNMGYSYSTPAIVQTNYGATASTLGFTVFFGNGYNSASQTPYLYAVNPQTGQSLPGTPINLCAQVAGACNSAAANGLSSVVAVNDVGGVGAPATTLYAGDLQGNVWRVNVSDPNSANWTVSVLLKATDPATGNPQPITTTPAVSLNPDFPRLYGTMVYVGTGQLLGIPDLSSTQVQSMYGVYDSGSNPVTLTRSDLVNQAMSTSTVSGVQLRFISGSEVALPSQNGWDVNFNLAPPTPLPTGFEPGAERVVADPRLDGGALVATSVIPSYDTCYSGDIAYLMEFNFAGGAFNNPQFNYTGTGTITSSLAAANGMLLGSVYASAPVFSNFAGGTTATGGGVALITLSSGGTGGAGQILAIGQAGLHQQRFSWQEIR
ncbi:MAG TPA: PilC/PilY family type IV pilus protein [Steroidobacteraceae bacterium]|nr:PilC/PilY family type IV pilus protein [Steroidobacteraceae bacterium]